MNCDICLCDNCPFDLKNMSTEEVFYEIHLTVKNARLDVFKIACSEIGVKPILLDLYDTQQEFLFSDMMTSSTFKGTDIEIFAHMNDLTKKFSNRGFNVIRKKIETVPWHKNCPSLENDLELLPNQYFESHLGVKYEEQRQDQLKFLCAQRNLHLSRNVMKKDNNPVIMATSRWHFGKIEDFRDSLKSDKEFLELFNFEIEKEIIEFAMYDSKIEHDQKWIS